MLPASMAVFDTSTVQLIWFLHIVVLLVQFYHTVYGNMG